MERAREMIASWDGRARLSGAFGIGFDFLNLLAYSTGAAMACAWVAQSLRAASRVWLSNVGVLLAWGQWAAVAFGTVQNAVMMSLLLGSGGESWLHASFWCTLLKLALLTLGPAYAALGGLALLKAGAGEGRRRGTPASGSIKRRPKWPPQLLKFLACYRMTGAG
jgi:hypothetical protein